MKLSKDKLTFNPRMFTTLTVVGVLLGWAVLPLPHTEVFPGVVVPLNQQTVYVPTESLVREIFVHRGQDVQAGQTLIKLDSPGLIYQVKSLEIDDRLVQKQLELLSQSDDVRPYLPAKQAEYSTIQEKMAGFKDLGEELNVKAKISGKLFAWNEYLRVGMALPKDLILGKIADPKAIEIVFFVPEASLDVVKEGGKVKFVIMSSNVEVPGTVVRVNPVRPQTLEYPSLASLYQGEVAVNPEPAAGKLKIVEAYYTVHVHLEPNDAYLPFGKTGEVEVKGPWRSKFVSLMRAIMRTLWREGSL